MPRRQRYRAYPTREQEALLLTALDATAWVFNQTVLAYRRAHDARDGSPDRNLLQRELVAEAKSRQGWNAVSAVSLQQAIQEAARVAWRASVGHNGWPSHRSGARGRDGSIQFTKAAVRGGFRIQDGERGVSAPRAVVPTIGQVRIKYHRALTGDVSSMTIGRDVAGWYVSYIVNPSEAPPVEDGSVLGIDVGVKHLASWVRIESDGSMTRGRVENIRAGLAARTMVARAREARETKQPGSRAYIAAQARIDKTRAKVTRQRRDHARKSAAVLLEGTRAVAIEGLDLAQMLATGTVSQGVLRDAGMGITLQALLEGARKRGVTVCVVEARHTSMTCSLCLTVRSDRVPLAVRAWTCGTCMVRLDRDFNAALVILRRAALVTHGEGETLNARDDRFRLLVSGSG